MQKSAWIKNFIVMRRDERASTAIEFGLFVPLLVTLLVGIFEIGFAMYGAMQVHNAAEAGLIYAAKNGWNQAGIASAVVSSSGSSTIQASPAPAQFCGCPTAGGVQVVACNANCPNGDVRGEYIRIEASLARTTLFSNTGLSLPATLTAQVILRQK
jgi:Flp pilus assembly protein TadG